MEWIDAKKEFPEINKSVLCYYTIPEIDKKRKPTGKLYQYFVIAHIQYVTLSGNNNKSATWVTDDYQPLEPEFWMPLPESPHP